MTLPVGLDHSIGQALRVSLGRLNASDSQRRFHISESHSIVVKSSRHQVELWEELHSLGVNCLSLVIFDTTEITKNVVQVSQSDIMIRNTGIVMGRDLRMTYRLRSPDLEVLNTPGYRITVAELIDDYLEGEKTYMRSAFSTVLSLYNRSMSNVF